MHPDLTELQEKYLFGSYSHSPLQPIFDSLLEQKKIELWIKRDDLIHPVISGNKWRKLKYILDHALKLNSHTLVSMGGAYSNHLHALAFMGNKLNLKTKAFIRGEKPAKFSATLEDLIAWGMQLHFVSRQEYRSLRAYKIHDQLPGLTKGEYWLAEGGYSELALKGVGEIIAELPEEKQFNSICVPCGTATTLAGLVYSASSTYCFYGFSALKNAAYLNREVEELLGDNADDKNNWNIQLDYHFGGFSKSNSELLLFMEEFEQQHGIRLDKVYTGKMFYGLYDLIKQDTFEPGHKIVSIHTGGLQGNR